MVVRILAAVLTVISALSLSGCHANTADGSLPPTTHLPPTPPPECDLLLQLPPTIKLNSSDGYAKICIENTGRTPVTLVMPENVSRFRMRNPIVSWSFLPLTSKQTHPRQPPPPVGVGRCGNINRLNPEELFVLQPGEKKDLEQWISLGNLQPLTPGRYRAVIYYSNNPNMKWSGIPLGQHDPATMDRVKRSTLISLVSNEVQVEITR